MSNILRTLFRAWNKFWFDRQPTYSLGIFRIVFGLFLLITFLISYPNWERFYGPQGYLPFSALGEPWAGYLWSILSLTDKEWFLWVIFWFAVIASAAFIIGLKTRVATIFLFVIFISMLHRNPFLINGQDQVAAMLLFFSIFAPLGASFSVDEFWRRFHHFQRSKEQFVAERKSMWALRLMQVSIALVYIFSGPAKYFDDITWRDGSAIYYVSLSDRWFRFPDITLFHSEPISMVLTFGTLLVEIAFPLFVWFSRTRSFVLIGITLFHYGMMIFMSSAVFFFNLMMLISFILFIPSAAMERLLHFLPRRTAEIFYDGQCGLCVRTMNFLKALDGGGRLQFFNFRNPSIHKKFPQLNLQELEKEMYLRTEGGEMRKGFFAYQYLAKVLPSLYFIVPLFYLPASNFLGPKIYNFVAEHRFQLFPCTTCGTSHAGVCEVKPSNVSD